jgi:hypothetical protein
MRAVCVMVGLLSIVAVGGKALGGMIANGKATEVGYYSGASSATTSRAFGASISTPNLNNGPTPPTPLSNTNQEIYSIPSKMTFVPLAGQQGPIDWVFSVTNSAVPGSSSPAQRAGVTQYDFTMDTQNSSGSTQISSGKLFQGFELELGTGTGTAFQPATLSGLSFDTSPIATTKFNFQTTLTPTEHGDTILSWENITNIGGFNYATGTMGAAQFSIEVPDDPDITGDITPYSFTLRAMYITAPEPSAALIWGLIIVLSPCRRRA